MSSPLKLLTLKAPSPQFDTAKGVEGLPQRILVMAWGLNETTQGPVIVNETTIQQLHAYNRSQNWDRPYFDLEHATIAGTPAYRGEPAVLVAPGVSIDAGGVEIVRGEGVYQLTGPYTAVGGEAVAGGHYPDLSPVVKVNAANEMIGLHSTAFCRHGATHGLIFLSATANPQTKTMDPKMPQTSDELVTELKAMLGLGTDAAVADIITAMKKQLEEAKALSSKTPGDNAEVKALSTKLDDLLKAVQAQDATIKLLSTTQETSERGSIMAAAAREGKQVPAMAKHLPIDQLKLLCAELPVTIPVGQRQTDSTLMLSGLTAAEDPELAKLDAEMGISKEDRQKYLNA